MRFTALLLITLACAACAGSTDGTAALETTKKKKDMGSVGCGSSSDLGAAPSDLGAAPSDLGQGATGGACGDTICRGDQICKAGRCTYACDGWQVPGDFATILSAMQSLSPGGGTICLGPQAYDEGLGDTLFTGPLTIIGAGADATSIGTIVGKTSGGLTIKGVTLGLQPWGAPHFIVTDSSPLEFEGVTFKQYLIFDHQAVNTVYTNVGIRYSQIPGMTTYASNIDFVVDGCDFTGQLSIDYSNNVTIQNSFFHDVPTNPALGLALDGNYTSTIKLFNNTFINMATPFRDNSYSVPYTHLWSANNIIYRNGVALDGTGLSFALDENNAIFANTTNYAGGALPGPHFVKTDPKLDTTTSPPRPGAGSPLVGAADPTYLPATDYWGRPRTSADIGAVQH